MLKTEIINSWICHFIRIRFLGPCSILPTSLVEIQANIQTNCWRFMQCFCKLFNNTLINNLLGKLLCHLLTHLPVMMSCHLKRICWHCIINNHYSSSAGSRRRERQQRKWKALYFNNQQIYIYVYLFHWFSKLGKKCFSQDLNIKEWLQSPDRSPLI